MYEMETTACQAEALNSLDLLQEHLTASYQPSSLIDILTRLQLIRLVSICRQAGDDSIHADYKRLSSALLCRSLYRHLLPCCSFQPLSAAVPDCLACFMPFTAL